MKNKWSFFLTVMLMSLGAMSQETITLWNFNGDNRTPSQGAGTLSLIGGVSETYAGGSEGRAINTAAYPVQGQNNGTAGIECAVSTQGFENIRFRFHHRASGTASRHAAVDYSIDGGQNWVVGFWNNQGLLSPNDNFYAFTVDFSSVAAANNNPDFRVRVVSVFSPCDFVENNSGNVIPANTAYMRANAAAQCAPHTTTVTGTYAASGTWRFDEVMLVGEPIGSFEFPLQIKDNGFVYKQNFDSLALDGTANQWSDNQTLHGWYWQYGNPDRDPSLQGYRAHFGNVNAVNAASLGDSLGADRAMGGIAGSNGRDLFMGLQFQNKTGKPIELSKLKLSFTGEQWRATANATPLTFSYKINPVSVINFTNSDRNWVFMPDFDFVAPKTDANLPVDGNDPDYKVRFDALPVDQAGVLPNNHFLALRWSLVGVTTPALGIDDLVFTYTEDADFSLNPIQSNRFEHVVGTPSAPQSFTVIANNALDSLFLHFADNQGFEMALDAAGPYVSNLALSPSGSPFNETIWVRLNAVQAGDFSDSLLLVYNNEKVAFSFLNGITSPTAELNLNADAFVFDANPYNKPLSSLQYIRINGQHLTGDVVLEIANGSDSMFWIVDANQNLVTALTLSPVNGAIEDSVAIQVRIPQGFSSESLSFEDSLRILYPSPDFFAHFALQVQWEKLHVVLPSSPNRWYVYPNPVGVGQALHFSENTSGTLRNAMGQVVLSFDNLSSISTSGLAAGMYSIHNGNGSVVKININ